MKIKHTIEIKVEAEFEEGFTSEAFNVIECIENDTKIHIAAYYLTTYTFGHKKAPTLLKAGAGDFYYLNF